MQRPRKPKHFRRDQARRLLWYRGAIDWKLHAGQMKIERAFRRVKRKLFVGNCARRFGKTFWLVTKAIETAIACKNPLPRIDIASATAKNLEKFIIPAFQIALADCPADIWPGWDQGYVRSKRKFIGFPNGAEIQLVGLDKDPDGLRGNYSDLVIVDEAATVDRLDYLYSSVIAPMTLLRPNSRILLLSTPSITPDHPFKVFCDLAVEQKAHVELTIHDNPLMTPELIAAARSECLTESDWLREYMCQFVVDETRAVVPEWENRFIQVIERPDYFRYLGRYVSMDLGTKIDLTAHIYGWFDNKHNYLYIEDEADMVGPKMTTPRLVEQIRAKEAELWPGMPQPLKRIADNNNPLLIQDMGSLHGLYFLTTNKDELHAMINELRKMLLEGRIIIHPRCTKLIACLQSAIWNKERSKLARSSALGHFDHLMALVYLVRNLDPYHNEIPDPIDTRANVMWLKQQQKKQKEIEKLAGVLMGFNKSK